MLATTTKTMISRHMTRSARLFSSYEHILTERRGKVGWITLNRPKALNGTYLRRVNLDIYNNTHIISTVRWTHRGTQRSNGRHGQGLSRHCHYRIRKGVRGRSRYQRDAEQKFRRVLPKQHVRRLGKTRNNIYTNNCSGERIRTRRRLRTRNAL